MKSIKQLALTLVCLAPTIALASPSAPKASPRHGNSNAKATPSRAIGEAPDMLALMQQQMQAMQQQMMAMQQQFVAEQGKRETREQELLREIASLKAGQKVQTVSPAPTVPTEELKEREETRVQLTKLAPKQANNSNSNAGNSVSLRIGEIQPTTPKQQKAVVSEHEVKQPERNQPKKEQPEQEQDNHQSELFLIKMNQFLHTPLMRGAISGDNEVVRRGLAIELETDSNMIEEISNLKADMVDPNAKINARALLLIACKDFDGKENDPQVPAGQLSLAHVIKNHLLQDLTGLVQEQSALSLAAVAGHEDVVETIVDVLLKRLETRDIEAHNRAYDIVIKAIISVLDSSSIGTTNFADVLFENMGYPNKPNHAHYPAIIKKLIAAYRHIGAILDEDHRKNRPGEPCLPSLRITPVMAAFMGGDPKILQVIAEQYSDWQQVPTEWPAPGLEVCAEMVARADNSGEKLGLLLTMDADPSSDTYRISRALLNHTQKNPKLLARLQAYVRKTQQINNGMLNDLNAHLLPDLSAVVTDYVSGKMPTALARRILAMEPLAEDKSVTEEELRDRILQAGPAPEAEPVEQGLLEYLHRMEKDNQDQK